MTSAGILERDGEKIELEMDTLKTVLVTMGGRVSSDRMAEFATALMSTQRGRLLLRKELDQEARSEIMAEFGRFLQSRSKDDGQPMLEAHNSETEELPPGDIRPWNKIPDRGYDRAALERLWAGDSIEEITKKVGGLREVKTIANRLTYLRKTYGEEIVPTREQVKKSGYKVGYSGY